MGLDQYAYKVKSDYDQDSKTTTIKKTEIAYWRKHNRLHGWMEDLFCSKGGNGTFNCQEVEVTVEDLDELEAAITKMDFPETGGFFFGGDSYERYEDEAYGYKKDDMAFIEAAREAIKDGFRVVYDSWW